MAKISPFLWFEGNMQGAVNFFFTCRCSRTRESSR